MAVVAVNINVTDVNTVLTFFDRVQVQRSKVGTPYTDAEFVTGDVLTTAELTGTAHSPFTTEGLTLKFIVDGGYEHTLTITSPDPVAITTLVEEITDTFGVTILAENSTGQLLLSSPVLGSWGSIEITGGTGLAALGFTLHAMVQGLDANVVLQENISDYHYYDQNGDPDYWYRTRFYNSVSGAYSSWSSWVQGGTTAVIDASLLATGYVKLIGIDGVAMSGVAVTVVNVFNPLSVGGYFIAGASKRVVTDSRGRAETLLIGGATVDVILEGTSICRRIVVPSTTTFDLLDPSISEDDAFAIQVPDLPAASRRSL